MAQAQAVCSALFFSSALSTHAVASLSLFLAMPSFCSHYTLDDLAQLSRRDDLGEDTPVLRATTDARSAGYDTVCIPLTNAKWKARWREMCLLNPNEDQATLNTIEQRAEAWRSKPAFFRDEVTISRLGACPGARARWESLTVRQTRQSALFRSFRTG